uniref:Lipocalin/cytosolic fatty-acid binding domain-containing protein n=1 Tax=Amblyomma maculatum TaxID=34609 RepID=G3ML70_AMBMU
MSFTTMIIFLSLFASALGARLTLEDAKEFLNTNQRMWMLQRSFIRRGENGENSCVNVRKLSVQNGDRYAFEHIHKEGTQWMNITIYVTPTQGKEDGDEPIIDVSISEDTAQKPYTMRYWDPETHCAILTFLYDEDGKTHCEMYQWESDIKSTGPPTSCDNEFDKLCSNKKYQVNKNCES